jgi:hypothetical protein
VTKLDDLHNPYATEDSSSNIDCSGFDAQLVAGCIYIITEKKYVNYQENMHNII